MVTWDEYKNSAGPGARQDGRHGRNKEVDVARVKEAAAAIRRELDRGGGRRRIWTYWRIGQAVATVCPGSKGRGHVAALALALQTAGVAGLGHSALGRAMRLAARLQEGQVRLLDRAGVSWRSASQLVSRHVPDRTRQVLLGRIAAGELSPTDLGKRIRRGRSSTALNSRRVVKAHVARAKRHVEAVRDVLYGQNRANPEVVRAARDGLKTIRLALSGKGPRRRPRKLKAV